MPDFQFGTPGGEGLPPEIITAAEWDSRRAPVSDVDALIVSDTGLIYRGDLVSGRWVLSEAYIFDMSEVATVDGDNADLTSEGWTHDNANGSTTTDGTNVTIQSGPSGTQRETWSVPLTMGKPWYMSGYASIDIVGGSQLRIAGVDGSVFGAMYAKGSISGGQLGVRGPGGSSLAVVNGIVDQFDDTSPMGWHDIVFDGARLIWCLDHHFNQVVPAGQIDTNPSTIFQLDATSSGGAQSSIVMREWSCMEGA